MREAAACGLASVLIAGSCAAEDVTDGRNGFFIEENAASMAATLRRLLPQRELLRQVGENARRELYISWDTSVANACRRYEVVLDNFRRGVYPARDTRVDDCCWTRQSRGWPSTASVPFPSSCALPMDEDVRQWHDEIQENRLNARENRQKLQEKLSQLRPTDRPVSVKVLIL